MGKNLIVSEQTVRDLLEAHASLSAWYFELWAALRAVNGTARPPDDAARTAFVERLAADFPELATVARAIGVPRPFVPAPVAMGRRAAPSASLSLVGGAELPARWEVEMQAGDPEEPDTVIEPAPARVREANRAASEAPPPLKGR